MIDEAALLKALPPYLPRQRWYAGEEEPAEVTMVRSEVLVDGRPGLLWAVVNADGASYQLLLGVRDPGDVPDFLHGHDAAVIGRLPSAAPEAVAGEVFVYDGLLDAHLALRLLDIVTDGAETARLVRPMGAEQSNSSVVYDDRVVLKVFRRLQPGANPDAEVTSALDAAGFSHVASPLAVWRRDGDDLAIAQPYLAGASEGWALALTSLRELCSSRLPPGETGGDFAGESCRLGQLTAELHLAMAAAFGAERSSGPPPWVERVTADLRSLEPSYAASVDAFAARLGTLADAGALIRVHGDYHLGQVVRVDSGWYVLDFEGEPARPFAERAQPATPLKDVGGMLRSFDYAVAVALSEREEREREELTPLVRAWEQRNRQSFLDGYLATEGVGDLLPSDPVSIQLVLDAMELEKAVYEIAYERAHRPDWERIPQEAISRLLGG